MKKTLRFVAILIIAVICFNFTVVAEKNVNVILDGEIINFDVPAQIVNGRTLVPMRIIFEKLGAVVYWDNNTRTAIAQKDNVNVNITIDNTTLYKNNMPIILDVPAQLIGGRTLVPLRAVSEAFGCEVQWDGDTRTVNIFTSNNLSPSQEAISELKKWIANNGTFIEGIEDLGYEIKKGLNRFTILPVKNSRDVVISYYSWTSKEFADFTIYLSDARVNASYFVDSEYSYLNGNIAKSISSNNINLTYNSSKSEFKGNKEIVLQKFDKLAEDTLIIFEKFLKENNIGLTLKDFELDYDLPEKSIQQNIAFDNLKDFVLVHQNDIVNNKPVFMQSDNSNDSIQYSIQYNDKNDTIELIMSRTYNNACIYSITTLTREDQTYQCTFSYYNSSNKSNTPDFEAIYTIDAGSFGEKSNINFENISGNKANVNSYKEVAKFMNLEMLNYTEFVFDNFLQKFECSMADFGFALE